MELILAPRKWLHSELDMLIAAYKANENGFVSLNDLAIAFGRSHASVALKASRLGLGDPSRSKCRERKDRSKFKGDIVALSAYRSNQAKIRIAEKGHHRGMAGKQHSASTRERLVKTSKAAWANKTPEQRQEWRDNLCSAMAGAPKVARGSWLAGWREIGGKRNYYRSRWEANYARYLEWLKKNGQILDWKHEPETFWFEAIKRGVRSYKPDFRVWELDGQSKLHEVKGWMDLRSKTTLKRMAKYHPTETVIIIREKQYNEIARKIGSMICDWERGNRVDRP